MTTRGGATKYQREHAARGVHADRLLAAQSLSRACCVCGARGKSRRLFRDERIGRDVCDRHRVSL
jgi:hypothetical protein